MKNYEISKIKNIFSHIVNNNTILDNNINFTDKINEIKIQTKKYFEENNLNLQNKNKNPEEINNCELILNLSDFYNDGNLTNPDNIILKPNLNEIEYCIINENLWNFFYSEFKGGPIIIREKLKLSDEIYNLEINYLSVLYHFKIFLFLKYYFS